MSVALVTMIEQLQIQPYDLPVYIVINNKSYLPKGLVDGVDMPSIRTVPRRKRIVMLSHLLDILPNPESTAAALKSFLDSPVTFIRNGVHYAPEFLETVEGSIYIHTVPASSTHIIKDIP